MSSGTMQFDVHENIAYRVTIEQDVWDAAVDAVMEEEGIHPDDRDEVYVGDVFNHLELENPESMFQDKHETFQREIYDR